MPLLQNLKRIRQARRLTVRELSARSGVSASTIYHAENLRRMPRPRTARRLAEALELRAEDLE